MIDMKQPGDRQPRSVLPVLKALVKDEACLDAGALGLATIDLNMALGLGAVLAYVTRGSTDLNRTTPNFEQIQVADAMARWTTAGIFETIGDVLSAARTAGCQPILLKGAATAPRYYQEPHLRYMTDIDVLVPPRDLEALESQLRTLGFEQTSHKPAGMYERHHHSMPFLDRGRNVWIELHTRPFPPNNPLAADPHFSIDSLAGHTSSVVVGNDVARVMGDELQLVYTSARWAETLKAGHGVFPILDVALLLRARGRFLDWDRVWAIVRESWAMRGTRAMLMFVHGQELADIPSHALRRLAPRNIGDRVLDSVVERLAGAFILGDRAPGSILTPSNLRTTWSALLRRKSSWANLALLAPAVAFPVDRPGSFHPKTVARRLRTAIRSPKSK
jgi:hypothetical protein